MRDDIIRDNLQIILESIVLIENHFSKVNSADDLVSNADGVLILDDPGLLQHVTASGIERRKNPIITEAQASEQM